MSYRYSYRNDFIDFRFDLKKSDTLRIQSPSESSEDGSGT